MNLIESTEIIEVNSVDSEVNEQVMNCLTTLKESIKESIETARLRCEWYQKIMESEELTNSLGRVYLSPWSLELSYTLAPEESLSFKMNDLIDKVCNVIKFESVEVEDKGTHSLMQVNFSNPEVEADLTLHLWVYASDTCDLVFEDIVTRKATIKCK